MIASRFLLILTILMWFVATPVAQAQPAVGSRLALNRCGGGDTVQYTLAVAGAITPDALIPGGIETPSFAESLAPLRPFLIAADLGIATLAGPLAGGPAPALAAALAESNLLLLGAAHPRLLDRGPTGVDATLQTLARYGIYQHGIASGGEPLPPFLKVTVPHPNSPLTMAFLSATWGLDGNADPRGQVNLLADAAGVLPAISQAIEQARRETDLVIVMAAWGNPVDPDPAQARINAARNLIAAGADLVIGSIPAQAATVDWVRAGDREGLAIFSTGDFIGADSAPATLMYVGVTRNADGAAQITGIRYLPVMPGNGNRGPTPLPTAPPDLARLLGDPGQLHVVAPLPPNGKIEVCPSLILPEMPDVPITGDFARFYQTFGGEQPRSLLESIALLGLPLGPVRRELAGDCQQEVVVLYTERQRLELHAANDWPNRVQGSHLGVVAFRLAYPDQPVTPRTDLNDPASFAHPRFRAFYERYGGLNVFGYPISDAVTERDPNTGRDLIVQYFERARFEFDPVAPQPNDPLWQVRLGLLGRETGAQALSVLCPATVMPVASDTSTATPMATSVRTGEVTQGDGNGVSWMLPVIIALVIALVIVILFAIYDFYRYIEQHPLLGMNSQVRSGYRSATRAAARPADTTTRQQERWQDLFVNFARRRKSSAAAPAEAPESPASSPTGSSRSLLNRVLRRGDGTGHAASSVPDWRKPAPKFRHTAESVGGNSATRSDHSNRRTETSDQAGHAQSANAGPSTHSELESWLHEPASSLPLDENGNRRPVSFNELPVDWSDLPPAERERWMMEIGPLDDEMASDLPPAERERWQSELAAPEPEFDPEWSRAVSPASETGRSTRRLDDSETLLDQQVDNRPDEADDLLRKLLGI